MRQVTMFTADGDDVQRRVDRLLGRAFELHIKADEVRCPSRSEPIMDHNGRVLAHREVVDEASEEARLVVTLRRRAVALEQEADALVPVEERATASRMKSSGEDAGLAKGEFTDVREVRT